MDGPRNYPTKWSKSDGERQVSFYITYLWILKHDTKKLTYENRNRLTDPENKLMVTKGQQDFREE